MVNCKKSMSDNVKNLCESEFELDKVYCGLIGYLGTLKNI
jgi:hypothetical protein